MKNSIKISNIFQQRVAKFKTNKKYLFDNLNIF